MRKPLRTHFLQLSSPCHTSAPAGKRSPLPCADWAGDQGWEGEPGTGQGPEFAQRTTEGQPSLDMCPLVPRNPWVW